MVTVDGRPEEELDASSFDGAIPPDGEIPPDDDAGMPMTPVDPEEPPSSTCRTRIEFGARWIPGAHPRTRVVDGRVRWNGECVFDGTNSHAVLSNGLRPVFRGRGCVISLDVLGDCPDPPPRCRTRVRYGPSWNQPSDHPNPFDDVNGVVTWDGLCHRSDGGQYWAQLSNGWRPHFSSPCPVSLRYEQCGGLYENQVARNCADPGVSPTRYEGRYVLVCTSGEADRVFRIRSSADLVHWRDEGHVFDSWPAWANGRFWAPEIHRVGDRWMVYYSARRAGTPTGDARYAIAAASAPTPYGPYRHARVIVEISGRGGVIDPSYFRAPDGRHFLLWKRNGNGFGLPTPIYIQELTADGVHVTGPRKELFRNDQSWEGPIIEGPWMIHRNGYYYLFYSGNLWDTRRYAVGVARATSPMGSFTKLASPILTSNAAWEGPGHGSIVRGPSGDWVHLYHAWADAGSGGRHLLADRVTWSGGWPRQLTSPMPPSSSQPMP